MPYTIKFGRNMIELVRTLLRSTRLLADRCFFHAILPDFGKTVFQRPPLEWSKKR